MRSWVVKQLEGQIVVITGGASGIGLASARAATEHGATVVTIDRVGRPADLPDDITHRVADVTDRAQMKDTLEAVVAEYGRVDVLFCNAGMAFPGSILDTSTEQIQRVFEVNVFSVVQAVALVLPHMLRARRGSIVVNTSNGGIMGRPSDPIYNASKHAAVGLVKSLALQYAADNIRVNAICPGAIDTPMLRSLAGSDEEFEQRRAQFAMTSPIPRVADADEVANAFIFLAGSTSSYVTGVALPVDGGKSAGVMRSDRYRTDFTVITRDHGGPTGSD
jgi:NAD(P)-dependent dehydrogenase (short-subunit alcohol dehydrogenase family)